MPGAPGLDSETWDLWCLRNNLRRYFFSVKVEAWRLLP